MLNGIYRAAMGMVAEMNIQDTLANNIANAATVAYKRKIPVFEAMVSAGARPAAPKAVGSSRTTTPGSLAPAPVTIAGNIAYVDPGQSWMHAGSKTDQSQGGTRYTGEKLDIALEGDGLFTLETPEGGQVYTRAGSFRMAEDGTLVSHQGYKVMGEQGPINVSGKSFDITPDGEVNVDGQLRGRLLISQFTSPETAEEIDGGVFRGGTTAQSSGTRVKQGYLETSNVNVVEEMVAMISCLRAYEAGQRAIASADSILGKAVNEVGRLA